MEEARRSPQEPAARAVRLAATAGPYARGMRSSAGPRAARAPRQGAPTTGAASVLLALLVLGGVSLLVWFGLAEGDWLAVAVALGAGALLWGLPLLAIIGLAERKGRDALTWVLLGLLQPWFGFVVLLVIPPSDHPLARWIASWLWGAPAPERPAHDDDATPRPP